MWFFLCETDTSEPAATLLISSAGVHSPHHHTGDGVRWKDSFKGSRRTNNEVGARMTDLWITDSGSSRHPRQLFQLQFETSKAWKIWEPQLRLMAHLFSISWYFVWPDLWQASGWWSSLTATSPWNQAEAQEAYRGAIIASHHWQVHELYLLPPLNYI